ncbi:hypothetical protein B0T25DRAFT_572394 [Lasiosphaeria hispida]|uniref:PD-(D/E)XK nuclease-like domain-containing protein n=1 Tax=Lasiosphaeria hispida TaxID=260671 RepID=A0AAJ0M8W5_9PEZI|nr:hypothetical protein B0T25DRAFT_572394 [Lasiosphaeria hispida]
MASAGRETEKNTRVGPRIRSPGKPAVGSSGLARRTRNTVPIQDEDDASAVSEDLDIADQSSISKSSAYTRTLQSHEVPSLPPPSPVRAPSTYTTSTKRSSSPVKSPLDLLTNLGKPVQYELIGETAILRKLKKDPIAPVYRRIRSLCHTQYIPVQIRDMLEREEADDDGDGLEREDELDEPDDKQDGDVLGLALPGSDYGLPLVGAQQVLIHPALAAVLPAEADHVLFQLQREFTILQEVVSTTREYTRIPHSEAAWNGAVHCPLLRLATAHIDHITVEDITRATISPKCSPDGKEFGDGDGGRVTLASGTKMVDYALVLSAPSFRSLSQASGGPPGHAWLDFVGRQHAINPSMPSSFNQTEYSPLRYSPAGLFVETKVDSGSRNEGRTQLGMWVAAWFKRVNAFRLSEPVRPPVVPVLLVYNETWDLYFAMDRGSWIEIIGKTTVGQTDSLPGIYKLLAVLRELTEWMAGPFRRWVDRVVEAGTDAT